MAIQNKFPEIVSHVLGKGLLAAILFKDPDSGEPDKVLPSRVVEVCMQKGLLVVHTGRESIKIGPPLTITEDCLREGIEVLEEATCLYVRLNSVEGAPKNYSTGIMRIRVVETGEEGWTWSKAVDLKE